MDTQYKKIESEVIRLRSKGLWMSNGLSFGIIAALTAPFTVLGTTLQLSSKKLEKYYEATTSEISKIELAKSHDLSVKERRFNELQLSSGMVGSNKPFRAPYYANYRQAFVGIMAQGYQGFYKGNFIEIFREFITIYPKIFIFSHPTYLELPISLRMVTLFGVDYLCELFGQPLRNAQTRMILQNRIPEFRTYRSIYKLFEFVSIRELMQGYISIFPKKLIFFSGFYWNFSDYLSHVASILVALTLMYPFETVQRRLEVQSTEHTMQPRRYLNDIRWCLSRIYDEEGLVKGVYRGFICNMVANTAKILIYPVLAKLVWEKYKKDRYLTEGWDLIN